MSRRTAPSPSLRYTAERYVLSTESGYLVAGTGIGGIPIVLTPDPLGAVRFCDMETAVTRARYLRDLGWAQLRIESIAVPLY